MEALPPRTRIPGSFMALLYATLQPGAERWVQRRCGDVFTTRVPGLGRTVIVADPALVKEVFTADPAVLHSGDGNPLAAVLGENSMFALDEERHLRQRRLLLPPFHGERMQGYEAIIEDETLREIATWPEGEELATLAPMMRITLNAILRAVFGATDAEFEGLRRVLPRYVKLGSRLVMAPWLQRGDGRLSPWGRLLRLRRQYDALLDASIAKARRDPRLDERADVLALLLQARHEDGTPMSRDEIGDQLLALLVAGHETTAGTLAWAFERLRRHPVLLSRLVAEADAGGRELRDATIKEVQRARPVITGTGRRVVRPFDLGPWRIPPGTTIFVNGTMLHFDPRHFADPDRFDPERFLGAKPDTYTWVPFGGGLRRCIGAAFAHMEMDVVLRTVLRELELVPTEARGERWRWRGVAFAPARGGRVVVRRRRP